MPVKRRTDKRRVNPEQEYQVWDSIFGSGYDFFDELPKLGLGSHHGGTVPLDLMREPWARLGARYLAETPRDTPAWAEEQFGRPWETDDAH